MHSVGTAPRERARKGAGQRREPGKPSPRVHAWVADTVNKRLREVGRHLSQGSLDQAVRLLRSSQGARYASTACIERLNGTMQERLATLTRRCCYAAQRLQALEMPTNCATRC
jgi:hypothetical protein